MRIKSHIERGVLFHVINTGEDFHSFHDLNLVLAPFVPAPAQPKINLLDIEGRDGSLDLTEANGDIKYLDRYFTFTFSVFPRDDMSFEERQTFVSNALNGQRCKITLDKDPEYYYVGRCSVNEYKCDKMLRQIVITATVAPYKLLHHETVISFELSSASQTFILLNKRKPVVPVIACTGDARITFGSVSDYPLTAGTHKILDIQLKHGSNLIRASGTGSITFTYQEGDL